MSQLEKGRELLGGGCCRRQGEGRAKKKWGIEGLNSDRKCRIKAVLTVRKFRRNGNKVATLGLGSAGLGLENRFF